MQIQGSRIEWIFVFRELRNTKILVLLYFCNYKVQESSGFLYFVFAKYKNPDTLVFCKDLTSSSLAEHRYKHPEWLRRMYDATRQLSERSLLG